MVFVRARSGRRVAVDSKSRAFRSARERRALLLTPTPPSCTGPEPNGLCLHTQIPRLCPLAILEDDTSGYR